jgi:hypothetical protein
MAAKSMIITVKVATDDGHGFPLVASVAGSNATGLGTTVTSAVADLFTAQTPARMARQLETAARKATSHIHARLDDTKGLT